MTGSELCPRYSTISSTWVPPVTSTETSTITRLQLASSTRAGKPSNKTRKESGAFDKHQDAVARDRGHDFPRVDSLDAVRIGEEYAGGACNGYTGVEGRDAITMAAAPVAGNRRDLSAVHPRGRHRGAPRARASPAPPAVPADKFDGSSRDHRRPNAMVQRVGGYSRPGLSISMPRGLQKPRAPPSRRRRFCRLAPLGRTKASPKVREDWPNEHPNLTLTAPEGNGAVEQLIFVCRRGLSAN